MHLTYCALVKLIAGEVFPFTFISILYHYLFTVFFIHLFTHSLNVSFVPEAINMDDNLSLHVRLADSKVCKHTDYKFTYKPIYDVVVFIIN